MDFKNFMQQAVKMQKQMEQQQADLARKTFDATAGNGAVKLSINGNYEVVAINIEDDLLSVDNKEILIDYLTLAINDCLSSITQEKDKGMENLGNSFDINSLLK